VKPPRNHQVDPSGCGGCAARLPLTLADRQRLHGRSFVQHDQTRDWHEAWCLNCGADLPLGFAALFHVCES
jgi:hypothetical protein